MTKFWIEDISYLFHSFYLIPTCQMDLAEQMNCMTRIILVIFIIMLFVNISYDVLFLAVSLLLIISVYYWIKSFKKPENFVEYYGKVETVLEPVPPVANNPQNGDFSFYPILPNTDPRAPCRRTPVPEHYPPLGIDIENNNPQIIDQASSSVWANREIPISETYSLNGRLVGPPNPRTLVQPIIPTPIYIKQDNDFIVPSAINDNKRQEFYQNGYVVTNSAPVDYENIYREYTGGGGGIPHKTLKYGKNEFEGYRSHQNPVPQPSFQQSALPPVREDYISNDGGYNYNYNNYSIDQNYYNQNGYDNTPYPSIDKACGVNPDNLNYNLPINYQSSECQRRENMKEYNKNLFSIPLQPGIYNYSQVNKPSASQSNMGISFTQPHLPTSFDQDGDNYQFTEHDPSQVRQVAPPPYHSENYGQPLRNEIYDPRLTGYGTSYRSYIEPVTGQPRFYYDDIDQYTQSNYITRNNLDIYGFAPRVGVAGEPILEGDNLRAAANANYTNCQLQQRTELQQRLMRKNSGREWQRRISPISTTSRAGNGGGTMSGFYK